MAHSQVIKKKVL